MKKIYDVEKLKELGYKFNSDALYWRRAIEGTSGVYIALYCRCVMKDWKILYYLPLYYYVQITHVSYLNTERLAQLQEQVKLAEQEYNDCIIEIED